MTTWLRRCAGRDSAAGVLVVLAAVLYFATFPFSAAQAGNTNLMQVTGVASNDHLNVRSGPSAGTQVVGRLAHDARFVSVLKGRRNSSWVMIRRGRTVGWVNGRYLEQMHLDAGTLKRLGVSISTPNRRGERLGHDCPAYGDEISLSVTDAFLRNFQRRGFTRETMCLALLSDITTDVETGVPLPLVDPLDNFRQTVKLNVPDCFKNGKPYRDCTFRFDSGPWGRLNPDGSAEDYREMDAQAKEALSDAISSGGRKVLEMGWAATWRAHYDLTIASPELPEGYAYQLTVQWIAGDDPEDDGPVVTQSSPLSSTDVSDVLQLLEE